MVGKRPRTGDLKDTVVRICPACGVVNPSGPSRSCPHLQLARYDGVDEPLGELIGRVAEARVRFDKLVEELKELVKQAARDGEVEIETTRKGRSSEVAELYSEPPPLSLVSPETSRSRPKTQRRSKRKPPQPPKVDPRQLELIAREPPKGDA